MNSSEQTVDDIACEGTIQMSRIKSSYHTVASVPIHSQVFVTYWTTVPMKVQSQSPCYNRTTRTIFTTSKVIQCYHINIHLRVS